MTENISLDLIMSMDLRSFNSLVGSIERLDEAKTINQSWTNWHTSQASGKDLGKWLKGMFKKEQPTGMKTSDDFLGKFGRGI